MDRFIQDCRFAARHLRRQPFFAVAAILMLALGIAGTSAMYAVLDGVFLRPLPFRDPEQLVFLDATAPEWGVERVHIAYPDFAAWRQQSEAFESMAVLVSTQRNALVPGGVPERLPVNLVTWDLAGVLGLEPIVGRGLTAADDRPGQEPVVLLGEGLWQRRFAGRPDAVGQRLVLNGAPHTIVGVLPRTMRYPQEAELWIPLARDPDSGYGEYGLVGVGRLRAGVTPSQGLADLRRIQRALIAEGPFPEAVQPTVEPLREHFVQDLGRAAFSLASAVVLVLLIACLNVSSLMLVRATARRREIGLRLALGAGRARLVRQLLTEGLLLAALGGGAGALLASVGVPALGAVLEARLPYWVNLRPDAGMLSFAAALSIATVLLFALAPALRASGQALPAALASGDLRASAGRRHHRLLAGQVVAQIAISLVIAVAAALLFASLAALDRVDPGFRKDGLLTFGVALPGTTYPEQARAPFFDQLLDRLRTVPGVAAAAAISHVPLEGNPGAFFVLENPPPVAGDQQESSVLFRSATPGLFQALGIELLAGRGFTAGDRADSEPVAVVNETFARRFGVDDVAAVLGRRIRFSFQEDRWITVVGVSRDIQHFGLDRGTKAGLYLPYRQRPRSGMTVLVNTELDPMSLVAPARSAVAALDPGLPIYAVATMADRLARSQATRRLTGTLLAGFAAVAVALALAGLYSVLAYAIGLRRREIAIRGALGARAPAIFALVAGWAVSLAAVGVTLGVGLSLAVTRLLASLLFAVSAAEPRILLPVAAGLLAAAVAAGLVPALRATRIDPVTALREV